MRACPCLAGGGFQLFRVIRPCQKSRYACAKKIALRENGASGHGKVVCYTAARRRKDRLAGLQRFQNHERLRFIRIARRENENVNVIEKAFFVRPLRVDGRNA